MPAELYKMLNKFADHLTGRFFIRYLALFSIASFLFFFTYHSYRNSILEDLLIKSLIDGARSTNQGYVQTYHTFLFHFYYFW